MFNIDNSFLDQLGLGMISQEEKDKMLAHIRDTLQTRIGTRVEAELGEEKANEFDSVISQNDPAVIKTWLETNLPSYQQIVDDEIAKIKSDIEPQVAGILHSQTA